MLSSIRAVIIGVVLLLATWIGWTSYNYFLDKSIPSIEVVGITQNGHYAGDMNLVIKGSHSYKISTISIILDDKPLNVDYRINRASFDRPLQIPTLTLPNGHHTLRVDSVSGTYHSQKSSVQYDFFVDNTPLQAAFIHTDNEHRVFQGRTLHLQFQTNKVLKNATVQTLSQEFPCFQENENSTVYECFIPVSCEETPNEYPFVLTLDDHVGHRLTLDGKLQVMAFAFKKQVLHSIKQDFPKERELGKPMAQLTEFLEQAAKNSPRKKLWRGTFYIPINMTGIVTEFGAKRISQEKGCYTHAALDLIGALKCVVWADADGIVIVKDRFDFSGNTVVIDHGWGILTLLYHLDSFADINVGDKIRRGQPVGKMGRTGYATGDHLHWEIRVNNVPVEPMQWTKTDF